MPGDWSPEEVEATVADYLAMLARELAREPVNKRAHNRALQHVLNGRSAGAVEFKHANISAVLIELGYPYIDGYKPRGNYQELLRDVVVRHLAADDRLRRIAEAAVTAPADDVHPDVAAWETTVVPAPERQVEPGIVSESRRPGRIWPAGVNYLEREARNRSLGLAGEEYVLRLEHDRLWKAGAKRLADKVEHVSRVRGDGAGYDVLSFETNGAERWIEVKTTRFGAMTPFFASRNEVEVSVAARDRYHLYRLFKYGRTPKLFVLPGSLRESVTLDPVVFRASVS